MECEVFSGPLLQKNVAVSEALTYKLRGIYGDRLDTACVLKGRVQLSGLLFYQLRVKRLLYEWYDSVRHLFSKPAGGPVTSRSTMKGQHG